MKSGRRLIWAILPIAAALAALFLFLMSSRPVITGIEPTVFAPGELIRLKGKNFGSEQGRGRLLLDGYALTHSSYASWDDGEIVFSLPPSVDSGLIQVAKPLWKSKALVVINAQHLPEKPADLPHAASGPSIAEALPPEAGPGALIQLRGINFGSELHASQVRFSRNPGRMALDTQADQGFSSPASSPQRFILPETPLMYEHWDDKLIQVRVPEEAGSGPLVVSTPHGESGPYHLRVSQGAATKYRFDPVSYSLEFEINVERKDQNSGGSLRIHIPNPPMSFSQNLDEIQSESHPSQGRAGDSAVIVSLENPPLGSTRVHRTLLVTVYNVESELSSYNGGFSGAYDDPDSPGNAPLFLKAYLEDEALIPSDKKELKTLTAAIIGRERNLQRKAGLIRTWLASRLDWLPDPEPGSTVIKDLAKRKAGSRNYALIATALFRAAGIPALPVSGFIVGDHGQGIPHFWMEYYLPAVGWIPYDPVLVYGAVPEGFTPPFIGPALYFGALDNRHIAIARGVDPFHSRIAQEEALQDPDTRQEVGAESGSSGSDSQSGSDWLFAEALEEAFGLEYSSDWKPVRILATY
ncbi:MAG: transglutaminase domain-containing protein [Spirochaetia bacterium]|jgi:transglutaminase-like putative cysteine protease|nr:transglutaminase domain-containing protein [Spirochaetia bacterium]